MYLKYPSVKRLAAKMLANNILTNGDASVDHRLVDQNELSSRSARRRESIIRDRPRSRTGWTRRARSGWPSPPTRAPAARPATGRSTCSGFNDYFGWYPGPGGTLADRRGSPRTSTRCTPATRTRRSWSPRPGRRPTATGPAEEKGTYAFQPDFANYHFGVYATKPYL